MAEIGFLDNIIEAAAAIDYGRKGFAIRGKAEEGRLSYEDGISLAMSTFKDAQSTVDPYTIILVEYTFLNQELQSCNETDKHAHTSLTNAIQSFDDAFLALEVVEDSTLYTIADETHPHHKDYRIRLLYPKDAYHVACAAHNTRLKNILRAPGIDPIEKSLLIQRHANLATAQSGYIEKQKKALYKEASAGD